ncbi:MAG TPA: DUF2793 domain-containing protein [Methyloceanibacter sp.]|jgi:hypothetical protein|nr:DUF2793 domain-containing protein [Methyloceanibacter sp.]
MAEESAKLRIPYIAAAQAQKHVTHNEAMTLLDTLVQLSVIDKDLTAPPGSPIPISSPARAARRQARGSAGKSASRASSTARGGPICRGRATARAGSPG